MKKSLLATLLMSSMAFGAFAEVATVDYTYADGKPLAYGKGKKETIDVAMCINNPGMAGMKVKGVRAYINTVNGLSETSIWLSKALTLESKVNVPDIASYDVTPQSATLDQYQIGMLAAQLDEPYVLTEEPVYIGYSMTVDDISTDAMKYPIVITGNINTDGFWLHMSKSVLKWTEYSEKGGGVAYIVVEIEGDFPAYSVSPVSVKEIYAAENEPFMVEVSVSNIGANPVNEISYSYTVDGAGENVGLIQLEAPIQPSLTAVVPVEFTFEGISGIGTHEVSLTLGTVDNQINSSANKTLSFPVNVIPFVPKHRPLVEEFTGLWCGWCTRGYLAMEEFIPEAYGDDNWVGICWHNGDAMTVTNSYPMNVSGFPSASVDRIAVIDPFYGSYNDEFGISIDIDNAISTIAIADIDLTASLEDGVITVNSSTRFIQDVENANYQVGYIITANGLSDDTWGQSNYYPSYSSSYRGSMLEELCSWPSTVYGLEFNYVAITTDGMRGVANSLPTAIKVNEPYAHEYTFNVANNKYVSMTDDIVANAFIVNKANGRIVNANKVKITDVAGVNNIADDATVLSTSYVDLTGRKIAEPSNGIYIMVQKMSDGTVRTSKVMVNNR